MYAEIFPDEILTARSRSANWDWHDADRNLEKNSMRLNKVLLDLYVLDGFFESFNISPNI